jgi:hypothetical protein
MQKIQNLGKREAASGVLLLQQLFKTPIVTAASVAAHTGFSRLGAQKVIDRFVAKDILKPKDGNRKIWQDLYLPEICEPVWWIANVVSFNHFKKPPAMWEAFYLSNLT